MGAVKGTRKKDFRPNRPGVEPLGGTEVSSITSGGLGERLLIEQRHDAEARLGGQEPVLSVGASDDKLDLADNSELLARQRRFAAISQDPSVLAAMDDLRIKAARRDGKRSRR
ncbi:MAG: hypothetical protein ABIH11_03425 [Candidatus Altiarchaeota archaeon]